MEVKTKYSLTLTSVFTCLILWTIYSIQSFSKDKNETWIEFTRQGHNNHNFYRQPGLSITIKIDDKPKPPRPQPKRILFWTEYFHVKNQIKDFCVTAKVEATCPYKCDYTMDKSLLNSSDVIVFHGGALAAPGNKFIDLPHRKPSQFWVFLRYEVPLFSLNIDITPLDGSFNWTLTYRTDSDLYVPYGRLVPRSDEDDNYGIPTKASLRNKTMVTWIVSRCGKVFSERLNVVQELEKFMQVDIYGGCGKFKCPPRIKCTDYDVEPGLNNCYKFIASKYKFYIAFENSLCQDYITEKVYSALAVGMVPIVYGIGNYTNVLPKNSYINVLDYESVEKVADYLKYLNENDDAYLKYFEWKKSFRVDLDTFVLVFCAMCTKVWTEGGLQDQQTIEARNVSDWWLNKPMSGQHKSQSQCIAPKDLSWASELFR